MLPEEQVHVHRDLQPPDRARVAGLRPGHPHDREELRLRGPGEDVHGLPDGAPVELDLGILLEAALRLDGEVYLCIRNRFFNRS